jgi:hypothetical protein
LHVDKSDGDLHDEIVRLEEHIEELAAKIESCRKFILASRIAMGAGGIVLAAMLLGAIRFDPGAMGGSDCGGARGYCRVGFKPQHRKGSGEAIGHG